mgnify:CR=1 FL=1
MDLEKIFKNLIIANVVAIFIFIIAAFNMPKDLMEIAEYVPAGIYETEFGAVLFIAIPLMIFNNKVYRAIGASFVGVSLIIITKLFSDTNIIYRGAEGLQEK